MADWDIEAPLHGEDLHRRPPRRFRPSYLMILTMVVIFAAGILMGLFVLRGQVAGDSAALADGTAKLAEFQKALSASEDRNWTYYRDNEALKAELEDVQAGSGASTTTTTGIAPVSPQAYSEGVYLVGKDIPAGTYEGAVTGVVGYWARLGGTDGSVHSIIANGLPRGPFVLTILPADKAIELRGVELTVR